MNDNLINSTIIIPNSWHDDLNITNEELTILILLYRNYIYYHSIALCNLEMLCNYMYVNSNSNKRFLKNLKDILTSLYNKNFISNFYNLFYEQITIDDIKILNKHSLFYVELPSFPTSDYLIIKNNEINMIFQYLNNSNLGKFSLIRYFIICKRILNNDKRFGYFSHKKLQQLITDQRTVQRYNTILQDELKLIRFNNDYITPEKYYNITFIGLYNDNEKFFNYQIQQKTKELKLIKKQ